MTMACLFSHFVTATVLGTILLSQCITTNSFSIQALTPSSRKYSNSLRLGNSANDDDVPKNADSLFQSDGWKNIQNDLDRVPIFCCANEQGHPLAYSIDMGDGKAFTVPFFYCDVDDALEELRKAKENTKLEQLDLIPFPLGKAFQMWAKDQAVIVPNKEAIVQAGAPPNTNPIGQQVPLFACMEIMQQNEKGQDVLPLFMSLDAANDAVKQAVEMDGGKVEDLEVVSLSLQRAIELLATVPETPAFQFMAPPKSYTYIEEYLS
jgi:hypothetical protein|uniref:Uncharacterized protein n=1 Tax=Attheya septentrionalis TaxID=420275 RepID=A0A7S2XN35_9STRA|mmetsp:Transcript_21172/g.38208  ORF Transcript_21172/g.38208 Transcript_21172/m.38208 type:complete len:264 (+) Transcript_21172:15-806(+)